MDGMHIADRVLILVLVLPRSSYYDFQKPVLCDSAKTYLNIRLLSSFASEFAQSPLDQRYLSLQKRARKRSRL